MMATFPCKSNKRKKKKKSISCPYDQNFSHLQNIYLLKKKHTITSEQYNAKSLQKLSKGHKSANIWCTVT